MTDGTIKIENLEGDIVTLDYMVNTIRGSEKDPAIRLLTRLRSDMEKELEAQKKNSEWKDLVAYWQDGTVCEVKFEGFRINKAGTIEMVVGEQWGTYLGQWMEGGEPYDTQDLRFKEHAWTFRIWSTRQDRDGWPLVEVA